MEGHRARHVATKSQWRQRLLDARRKPSLDMRAAETAALVAGVVELADGVHGPVCMFVATGDEPGAGPAGAAPMVDALIGSGHTVLLPVVPLTRGPLDWARYDGTGSLAGGPFGLREPTGPRLGPAAVATAGLVLVPALAVDRRGYRIGYGGGYYDWTLPLADPAAALVAVVRDEELVEELPTEAHDMAVDAALTPGRGRLALPR